MRWYSKLVISTSESAWLFVMSAVFAFGSLAFVFNNIKIPFEKTVGSPMFDFQNTLTTAQIFEQLPHYDESMFALYDAFLFIDFYFPFFAGLVMAAAGAFALRHLAPEFYKRASAGNLFALFLIPTVFDWGENTFALALVNAYPTELQWAATGLVLFKKAKLAGIILFQGLVILLLLAAAFKWVGIKTGIMKS